MGLRLDRQTALGWLGIEGYRPSGRVPLPAGEHGPEATEIDERPASEGDLPAGPVEATVGPVATDVPESNTPTDTAASQPQSTREESSQQESAAASVPDRLSITAESAHRRLAETIGRVAGLACETGEGDRLTLAGETWELSTLAGDGKAKRRLWRLLVERARRPRT